MKPWEAIIFRRTKDHTVQYESHDAILNHKMQYYFIGRNISWYCAKQKYIIKIALKSHCKFDKVYVSWVRSSRQQMLSQMHLRTPFNVWFWYLSTYTQNIISLYSSRCHIASPKQFHVQSTLKLKNLI